MKTNLIKVVDMGKDGPMYFVRIPVAWSARDMQDRVRWSDTKASLQRCVKQVLFDGIREAEQHAASQKETK